MTTAPAKIPTRPGSRWATGRRHLIAPPKWLGEPPGFNRGALVDRKAHVKATLRGRPRGHG